MARVEIPEVVLDTEGRPVEGASCQVNLRSGGAATVYADATSSTTVANPIVTGALGRIEGWLAEGSYDLVVSSGDVEYTQSYEAVSGGSRTNVWNPVDAAYGADPTGVEDSTAAFQAAMDALQDTDTGGTFQIPEGTFLLDSATAAGVLIPGDNVPLRVLGSGEGQTIIKLTDNTPSFLTLDRTADDQTFSNIEVAYLTVDGDEMVSPGQVHTVIGNKGNTTRVNLEDIHVHHVSSQNIPSFTTDSATGFCRNVYLASSQTVAAEAANVIHRIKVEDCNFQGGNIGVQIIGTGTDTIGFTIHLDDIMVQRVKHDVGTLPTTFVASAGVHVGSRGYGGRATIRDCHVKNCGDVGIETNSLDTIFVDNCTGEDCRVSFYYTNYNTPQTAEGQTITYRDCKSLNFNYAGDSTYIPLAFYQVLFTVALGHVRLLDCQVYQTANAWSGTGKIFSCSQVKSMYVRGLRADFRLGTYSDVGTASPILMQTNWTTKAPLRMRDVRIYVSGVRDSGGGAGNVQWTVMNMRNTGMTDVDIDGFSVDASGLTGIAANNFRVFYLGLNTTTFKGRFRRCNFGVLSDDSGPRAFIISGTTNLTITDIVRIEDCDFRDMTAGTEILFTNSNENKDKVYLRRNMYRTWPSAPASISPGASPYEHQNLDGYPEQVSVSGGTVTAIDISKDGSSYTASGLTSGIFQLENGDKLKVTYSVAPTMKKYPLGKQ